MKSIPSAVFQKISAASSGVRSGMSSPRARPRSPVTSWASASPARYCSSVRSGTSPAANASVVEEGRSRRRACGGITTSATRAGA